MKELYYKIVRKGYGILVCTILSHWRYARVRGWMLRFCGINVGKNVAIGQNVVIKFHPKLTLGDGCSIADEVMIGGDVTVGANTHIFERTMVVANGGHIQLGADCQIAHMVSIKTSTHKIEPSAVCIGGKTEYKDIFIGNGCWIAAGVIVLPGVKICDKVLVASGAVVSPRTNGAQGVLIAGVPACVKKHYSVDSEIKKLTE